TNRTPPKRRRAMARTTSPKTGRRRDRTRIAAVRRDGEPLPQSLACISCHGFTRGKIFASATWRCCFVACHVATSRRGHPARHVLEREPELMAGTNPLKSASRLYCVAPRALV